jgi:Tol biopolymer transport system component
LSGLYIIYPSTRKPLRLVAYNGSRVQLGGVLSPDNRTVIYDQQPQNGGTGIADHLFRVPASGGKAKQLTFGSAADGDPIFTPNGRWILFDRTNAKTIHTAVYAIPAQGGTPHAVGVANVGLLGAVSPDGSTLVWRILYALHAQSFDQATATVTSDTPDHVLLSDVSGGEGVWSPDGLQIGFGRQSDLSGTPVPHAAIANADGTGERTISHDRAGYKSTVISWLPAPAAAKWEH